MNISNSYLAAAHAKRRELEFQNQADGGNPYHAQHIIQFCDYAGDMDPMSTAFLQMASIFNQLELSLIRERVRSGVANAKAKGKQIGRKPTTKDDIPAVFYKHFPAFQAGHMNASEFARICGLSRTTVYKYLKLLE